MPRASQDVLRWRNSHGAFLKIYPCPPFPPPALCSIPYLSPFSASLILTWRVYCWMTGCCLAAIQAPHLPDCCSSLSFFSSNSSQQYWFSWRPISGSVSRSADVFLRAAMMDSHRDLQCEWLMVRRHLWRHWGMDSSNVIYHSACQCQYKRLMENTHTPLKQTQTCGKICSRSPDKVCVQHLRRMICRFFSVGNK